MRTELKLITSHLKCDHNSPMILSVCTCLCSVCCEYVCSGIATWVRGTCVPNWMATEEKNEEKKNIRGRERGWQTWTEDDTITFCVLLQKREDRWPQMMLAPHPLHIRIHATSLCLFLHYAYRQYHVTLYQSSWEDKTRPRAEETNMCQCRPSLTESSFAIFIFFKGPCLMAC